MSKTAFGSREIDIQQAILLDLGARPDLRIWRVNVGTAIGANGRPVRFGTPGAADIQGILEVIPGVGGEAGVGRFIALEVKSATGRLRPEQAAWGAMVRSKGGFYAVVRSVEEARQAIVDARLEAWVRFNAAAGAAVNPAAAAGEARHG